MQGRAVGCASGGGAAAHCASLLMCFATCVQLIGEVLVRLNTLLQLPSHVCWRALLQRTQAEVEFLFDGLDATATEDFSASGQFSAIAVCPENVCDIPPSTGQNNAPGCALDARYYLLQPVCISFAMTLCAQSHGRAKRTLPCTKDKKPRNA